MNQELFREKSRHGSALFPFECYIQDSIQSVLVKDHHWHDEMEWIFLQKGKIKIEIDFTEYTIEGRALICIPRGALHKISTIGACLYYAFVFQIQMLQSVTYDHCESSLMVPLANGEIILQKVICCEDTAEEILIDELMKIVSTYFNKDTAWSIEVKSSLMKVIGYLVKHHKIENQDHKLKTDLVERSERIKKSITYMKQHIQEKIYLSELAALVSMNETYFCRYFKESTGMSPIEYLINIRIEEASRLIRETDHKIIDICYLSGFENSSYFIRKFYQSKQITPKKYALQFRERHIAEGREVMGKINSE